MRGILSFVAVSVIFGIFSGVLHAQKLDKGVCPYGEFWKPIPTQRYWAPDSLAGRLEAVASNPQSSPDTWNNIKYPFKPYGFPVVRDPVALL